jgi:deoxyadenosine/deoxycytidine kinase
MNFSYLVIEGPIGAGKTTLAKNMSRLLKTDCFLDNPWENPFLSGFYQGKPAAAFQSQLYFLADRVSILHQVSKRISEGSKIVSDFLLEKDKLFAYQNLDDDELILYNKLFDTMSFSVAQPSLVIYLKASLEILMNRITQRAKRQEKTISPKYVQRVMDAYEHFFFNYRERTNVPVLVVETSKVDLSSSKSELENLVQAINHSSFRGLQYYSASGKGT